MPTAKLVYDLENERNALEAATKGQDLAMAVDSLSSILRNRIKHDEHISGSQRDMLEWARDQLYTVLDDYGIDLERLL